MDKQQCKAILTIVFGVKYHFFCLYASKERTLQTLGLTLYCLIPFIINKVMKYRKILIKYNAYFKKAVFHSRENIKSCIFTAVKI